MGKVQPIGRGLMRIRPHDDFSVETGGSHSTITFGRVPLGMPALVVISHGYGPQADHEVERLARMVEAIPLALAALRRARAEVVAYDVPITNKPGPDAAKLLKQIDAAIAGLEGR